MKITIQKDDTTVSIDNPELTTHSSWKEALVQCAFLLTAFGYPISPKVIDKIENL